MSTYIRRCGWDEGPLCLSPEQRRRAENHLRTAGYDIDRFSKLVWPDDAVAASREHPYAPWKFTLKSDVRAAKIKRMNERLWVKREQGRTAVKCLYVWVFYCPGISGIFEGLWTYLVGIGNEQYHGGGKKGDLEGKLLDRVKALLPIENPRPLIPLHHQDWMRLFVKKYERGKWCGRVQGKAAVRARIVGGQVREIIESVEWPRTRSTLPCPPRRASLPAGRDED